MERVLRRQPDRNGRERDHDAVVATLERTVARGKPNGHSDSGGNAVYATKTSEIRALLEAHGGSLDPYDLVWKDEDDEVMRRVRPEFGMWRRLHGRRHARQARLLKRLLDAGIRVPSLVTGCQSYLMEQPDMFRTLLDRGMNPDTCNWQMQTMLHLCCRGDGSGRPDKLSLECAALLLDRGGGEGVRCGEVAFDSSAGRSRALGP
jgi:hypothetical protein